MSNELDIFQGNNNLPAHLQKANVKELTAGVGGGGFPVISIKSAKFAVVRDGERDLVRTKDGGVAPHIDVVIIEANKHKSKVFYASGYTEGSDAKPDCFSNDGIKPDASAENPQCASCAACEKNVWGSKVTENGAKGKLCSDSIRLAVATRSQINDPMLLRVPAASIRPLDTYSKTLAKRGVPYNGVLTRIRFDEESSAPKLFFNAVDFLDADEFAETEQVAKSDTVRDIIGVVDGSGSSDEPSTAEQAMDVTEKAKVTAKKVASTAKEVKTEEVEAAIEEVAKPVKAKAAKPKVEESVDDLDFDDVDFDD